MLKIEYWKAVPVSFLKCIKWGQSEYPHTGHRSVSSSWPQLVLITPVWTRDQSRHVPHLLPRPLLTKPLRISPSPPSSVFISRAPVSGHGEWRGHVFCCCTSTAVTFPFYCSFVTYGLILKVVFQEILDINSHSILTDSFLPSCR